ncbi:MAG: hypothetical protein WBQ34_14280 [Candidatus Acidiferrales bacterium]
MAMPGFGDQNSRSEEMAVAEFLEICEHHGWTRAATEKYFSAMRECGVEKWRIADPLLSRWIVVTL